jgi:hypothetical protein
MSKIIKSKRSFGFVQIPNDLIQRPDMSAQAKGLICYLLSLPDDWVIYKKEIANHFTNGRTSLDAAFEELENLGYLVGADQVKNNGKFAGRDYILYDKPFGNTDVENQHLGISDAQNQHRPMHKINNGTDAQNQHLQIHSNKDTITNTQKPIARPKETQKPTKENQIPDINEFLAYAIEKKPNVNKEHVRLKYEAWKQAGWKTGTNNKIVNWKSTLANTLPYIKEVEVKADPLANYR